jgi:hypothetical protein
LLAVSDPMSPAAMPEAPKLACSRVSLGAAAWTRRTNGMASPAPAAASCFKAVRLDTLGAVILGSLLVVVCHIHTVMVREP